MPHTLRTDRLLLRQTRLRDAPALARVFGDYEVTKTTGTWPHPVTADLASWRIRQWQNQSPPELIGFSVIAGQDLVGQVGMRHRANGRYLLGYTIGLDWWGKGYCTEAVRALCEHAFCAHKVRMIDAEIFTVNTASIAVALKCGFTDLGVKSMGWSTTLGRHLPSSVFRLKNERPF